MGNLRSNKTEEEWEQLEQEALASAENDKAKEQATKDMEINIDGVLYTLNFDEYEKTKKFYNIKDE